MRNSILKTVLHDLTVEPLTVKAVASRHGFTIKSVHNAIRALRLNHTVTVSECDGRVTYKVEK